MRIQASSNSAQFWLADNRKWALGASTENTFRSEPTLLVLTKKKSWAGSGYEMIKKYFSTEAIHTKQNAQNTPHYESIALTLFNTINSLPFSGYKIGVDTFVPCEKEEGMVLFLGFFPVNEAHFNKSFLSFALGRDRQGDET